MLEMSFFPDSFTLPTKVGIQSHIIPVGAGFTPARNSGRDKPYLYDVPAKAENPNNGHSCESGNLRSPVKRGMTVEPFPGGKYIALRITDPFAEAFDRIPKGWQKLVNYIKSNDIKVE